MENLKNIAKRYKTKREEGHSLSMNSKFDEKFQFNAERNEWNNFVKKRMLKHQFDIISKEEFYRLDMSQKLKDAVEPIKAIQERVEKISDWHGLIRIKKYEKFLVDEYFCVTISQAYETERLDKYESLKKEILERPEEVAGLVVFIMEEEIELGVDIKYEVELNF